MKKILLLNFAFFIFYSAVAQTFWTEGFGTGCNSANPANGYNSSNGTWTVAATGTNDSYADVWYVSGKANNNGAGNCVSGCSNSNNRTLHIGNADLSSLGVGPDSAATYLTGLFCPSFNICSTTNRRAESPAIDCSGYSGIAIQFLYIEGGEGAHDDARLMYYDGASWYQLDTLAKTTVCASTSGIMTSYMGVLPTSADNNPDVKIGFSWTNDNDAQGSDPSFAVDDISLSGSPTSVAENSFADGLNIFCSGNIIRIDSKEKITSLSVIDLFGREILFQRSGNTIDLSGNAEGVYFIRAEVNGKTVTKKVSVVN